MTYNDKWLGNGPYATVLLVVATTLVGVMSWVLVSIVDLKGEIKTLEANQIWELENVKNLVSDLKTNKDQLYNYMMEYFGEKPNGTKRGRPPSP